MSGCKILRKHSQHPTVRAPRHLNHLIYTSIQGPGRRIASWPRLRQLFCGRSCGQGVFFRLLSEHDPFEQDCRVLEQLEPRPRSMMIRTLLAFPMASHQTASQECFESAFHFPRLEILEAPTPDVLPSVWLASVEPAPAPSARRYTSPFPPSAQVRRSALDAGLAGFSSLML